MSHIQTAKSIRLLTFPTETVDTRDGRQAPPDENGGISSQLALTRAQKLRSYEEPINKRRT